MLNRILFFCATLLSTAAAQTPPADGALPQLPLEKLSDRSFTALGQRALAIKPAAWLHAETDHFIYHFSDAPTAAAVSVEAEFYYRVIATELGRDTAKWERKCHLFLFNDEADWKQFQGAGGLDPWTGGIHAQGSLFLLRNKGWIARNQTLPHEISHLVFERFIGAGVPLWLNEGFAEYSASRCRAAFYRARGYAEKPRAQSVPPALYQPLAQLTAAATYPTEETAVGVFYDESEKLVRFLAAADKRAFIAFLDAMGKGARFDTALSANFGSRFPSLDALEKEFKPYATSPLRPN
jgi:hypothetical protein